jgi:hypothetical protein
MTCYDDAWSMFIVYVFFQIVWPSSRHAFIRSISKECPGNGKSIPLARKSRDVCCRRKASSQLCDSGGPSKWRSNRNLIASRIQGETLIVVFCPAFNTFKHTCKARFPRLGPWTVLEPGLNAMKEIPQVRGVVWTLWYRRGSHAYATGSASCLSFQLMEPAWSFKFQVPSFKFQASSFKFQVSSFKFQVSSFEIRVSSFKIAWVDRSLFF